MSSNLRARGVAHVLKCEDSGRAKVNFQLEPFIRRVCGALNRDARQVRHGWRGAVSRCDQTTGTIMRGIREVITACCVGRV